MTEVVVVAVGGAFGAVGRYLLSGWAYAVCGERFPYGTLAVNVVGCLLIGFVMHIGLTTDLISRNARLLLTTGILGALTTFSTFTYETMMAVQGGHWGTAFLNIALNVVLGLGATFSGLVLARQMVGGS
ncbi:MAG: fluoride efflux transporter CrcB [Planctomycetota bacterium]|jgi:CrcB protein